MFFSNLSNTEEIALVDNLVKKSLAKGTARSNNILLLSLPNALPRNPPDWIILDIWVLLSLISIGILLAKVFLILVVCLFVRNNSFGNYSSSNFFLFNLNIFPVLFLDTGFNLFNCVFVSLTFASS